MRITKALFTRFGNWGLNLAQNIVLGPNYRLITVTNQDKIHQNLKNSIGRLDCSYSYAYLNDGLDYDLSVVSISSSSHRLKEQIIQKSSDILVALAINPQNRATSSKHFIKNQTGFGFCYSKAIHQHPLVMNGVFNSIALIDSECLAGATISLPIFPGQIKGEIKRVLEAGRIGSKKFEMAL